VLLSVRYVVSVRHGLKPDWNSGDGEADPEGMVVGEEWSVGRVTLQPVRDLQGGPKNLAQLFCTP